MKKFVVSYINFNSNILTIKIVEAEDWLGALAESNFYDHDGLSYINSGTTSEEAKQHAFDMDSMFEVVEIV